MRAPRPPAIAPAEPDGRPTAFAEEPLYGRADDSVDLRDLWDMLVRGRWIVLAAVLLCTLPAAAWTYAKPELFSAYTLMLVEKNDRSLSDVLPGRSPTFFGEGRNLENEILVLQQSMPLALSAAERLLEVARAPGRDAPLSVLAPVRLPGGGERSATPQDVAFRLQAGYVSVAQQGREADALRVSVVSEDPAEAALVANVYTDAFVELSQASSRASVSASRTFLESQVGDREANMTALDAQVRQFMLREGAVALDQETRQIVDQLATIGAQRDAAAVEAQMKAAAVTALRAELVRVEPRLSERVASGADAQIAAAQTRIVELEAELEPFYRRNPEFRDGVGAPEAVLSRRTEIARLQDRIRGLAQALTNESVAVGGGGPGDTQTGFRRVVELRRQLTDEQIALDGVRAQQAALDRQVGELEGKLRTIPGQSIELAQLQRQRLGAERLYSALDEKLQEARVAEQSQLGYATVIRPAFPAAAPFGPNRVRDIGVAVLLGLLLGVGGAITRVRLDGRIHRPDDLRSADLPVIGTIPDMAPLLKTEFGTTERVPFGERSIDTHLMVLLNPMATVSETYRALRTSVQFSRPDAPVRTVLVTSSVPGEGKSVTAANLAAVLAQSGRRVLLIDADLRRPTVHKKFGLSREPGLVQALFAEGSFDESAVVEIADDLFVLPAGAIAHRPSELLGSKRMRELLAELLERYDLVVLDAPPVLAATDAVLLSTQADATLVVARAGKTRDYELTSAHHALQGVGAHVIGVVFNGFDVSKAYGYRYKYAYRYGQDYAYGHDDHAKS